VSHRYADGDRRVSPAERRRGMDERQCSPSLPPPRVGCWLGQAAIGTPPSPIGDVSPVGALHAPIGITSCWKNSQADSSRSRIGRPRARPSRELTTTVVHLAVHWRKPASTARVVSIHPMFNPLQRDIYRVSANRPVPNPFPPRPRSRPDPPSRCQPRWTETGPRSVRVSREPGERPALRSRDRAIGDQ
jgi:hypothetical protein